MGCCSIDLTIANVVFLCAIVFTIKKLYGLYKKWRIEQMLEKWEQSCPKDKVLLHTVGRCRTLPSISPYGLKVETYLRMAKIPYELETKDMVGPKGKFPWITYNGTHVADSHLIIQFLNKKFSVNLNKSSTPEQVASSRVCRIVLEDHFKWGVVQYRWIENAAYIANLVKLPTLFKYLMPLRVRQFKKGMNDQGMGKHTPTEIYQMTEEDLRTVSTMLGSKKFFGGEEPCEDDASLFGFIAQVLWGLPGSSFERLAHGELSNLKDYADRMKDKYWPDWGNCIDKS